MRSVVLNACLLALNVAFCVGGFIRPADAGPAPAPAEKIVCRELVVVNGQGKECITLKAGGYDSSITMGSRLMIANTADGTVGLWIGNPHGDGGTVAIYDSYRDGAVLGYYAGKTDDAKFLDFAVTSSDGKGLVQFKNAAGKPQQFPVADLKK